MVNGLTATAIEILVKAIKEYPDDPLCFCKPTISYICQRHSLMQAALREEVKDAVEADRVSKAFNSYVKRQQELMPVRL
jgi:dihydroorotase